MKYIILVLLILASQINADPQAGLRAHYMLNGNLQDSTGNHADAVNVGCTLTSDPAGNADSAYDFIETGDTIQIPVSTINGLTDYTVSFWIKASNTYGNAVYYSFAKSTIQRYLQTFFFSKYFGIGTTAQGNNFNQWSLQNNISNGNWQFVAISRDTANLKYHIYVDGQLWETIDVNGYDDALPKSIEGFVFGNLQNNQVHGGYQSYWQYFGALYDVRIYGRSFSPQDAQEVQGDAGNSGDGNGNGDGNGDGNGSTSQDCIDQLAILEPGTITEELTFPLNTDENEYYHHYDISFNAFTWSADCFETQVWLGGNMLDHEVVDNGIIITFPWKDAETWGCTQQSPTLQQCQFQLLIFWDNVLQHKKLFSSTITTPDLENVTQELQLNVINDEDESLKEFDQTLDTQLQFCDDIQCSNYITPNEIIRNTDVYVEFKVNTPGYNQYFPIHSRLTLNDFQVEIQNQNAIDTWATQGKIIYHFRPPFASQNILLAIGISLSQTNPNARLRRMLQNNDVDTSIGFDEQKDNVGKYMRINIVDENDVENGDKKEKDDDSNTGLIIGLVAGAVVIISLVGIAVYFKLKSVKPSTSDTKYSKQKEASSVGSNENKVELDVK